MAKGIQDKFVKLECVDCKTANYRAHKNKKILKNRLELSKYCKKCKAHTTHKETK